MVNKLVPDSDHISRFCRGRAVDPNGRITGTAFELREHDKVDGEFGMSVNWLEFLKLSNRTEEIHELRMIYKNKRLPIDDRAKIGVLNVEHMRGYVFLNSEDNREIEVEHRNDSDPSHCRIIGNFRIDDEMIFDLLADCILEDYSAKP